MTKVVKTTIESNLSSTPHDFQDPITVAIPPPLTPDELQTSKLKTQEALRQLAPENLFQQNSKQPGQQSNKLSAQQSQPSNTQPEPQLNKLVQFDPSETQAMLSQKDFAVDWKQRLDNEVLDKFVNEGFIVLDEVYPTTAILALQTESGFIDYRDAKLTEGVRKTDIRGDRIRWITDSFYAGYYYLQSINELGYLFNRSFFAGIRHSEAHYACYPAGFGYKWHSDNPAGRDERVISAVFYLNDDWELSDGGELSIIDTYGKQHQLLPKANRLVIFNSDLQHQVEIAHRQRYSIATWLRRDDAVLGA